MLIAGNMHHTGWYSNPVSLNWAVMWGLSSRLYMANPNTAGWILTRFCAHLPCAMATDNPIETLSESHGRQGTGAATRREGSWRQIPHHELNELGLQPGCMRGRCPRRCWPGGGALVPSPVRF